MAKSKKSLAETHPELVKEWHPTKNGSVTPDKVVKSFRDKVWWKCNQGDDHEWSATIYPRTKGVGCPVCAGKKVVYSNSLAHLNPSLASEWDKTRNSPLLPSEVRPMSNKKVWWKCSKEEDHVWQNVISNRSKGQGCPYCSGKKASRDYSLLALFPHLVEEWDDIKNKNLSPHEITPNSNKSVWWRCDKGKDHEWKAQVISRTARGTGCPVCAGKKVTPSNSLKVLNPDLSKEWHIELNGELTPDMITEGSKKKVWWKCSKEEDHVWSASVASRAGRGNNCPYCAGQAIAPSNSLNTLRPDIAKEWHPTKNKDVSPDTLGIGSGKSVWWLCHKGADHEWKAQVISRTTRGTGCPVCAGKKVVYSNSLAHLNPSLASEWDITRNSPLLPSEVRPMSNKKVWWKCSKEEDHVWSASVASRAGRGNNCPYCAGQAIAPSNSLNTLRPDIAKEWHPTKNKDVSPDTLGIGSGKSVWWLCDKGADHEWKAQVISRTAGGTGCPVCAGQKVVPSNSIAILNPTLAIEWHPTKNGTLSPENVGLKSHKNIWWKCPNGDDHEYQATLANRSRGDACPICSGHKVVDSNSLQTLNPLLAKEWHSSLNKDLTANDVTIKSNKKVYWQCRVSPDHIWKARIHERTRGNGCPYCTLTPQSKQELTITFELKTLFKQIDPKGFKTRLDGRLRAIDIFIPKLNLCIEFDGSYWHKDKREIDKIKSNLLLQEGYNVIRVREEPLKKIHESDVISKQPYNGKQVTNDILSMILSMNDLDYELVQRIKEYQSKDELQNERGLDRYIDKILKEKAEKK